MNTNIETYTIKGFIDFCKEREHILKLKNSGKEFPWTKDIILATKKFCNIDRKDDRMTVEFLKVIKNKEDDLQIIGSLFFRATTSGSEVPLYLDKFKTLKGLIKDFSSENTSLIQYNKNKMNPYQFVSYIEGYSIKKYIVENLFKNSDSIIDYIKNSKKETLLNATNKVCELLKFPKNLFFITFQGLADISYLFPNNIDENSVPYFGIGSKSALKEIALNEDKNADIILEILTKKTKYNLLKIEHGLCEYDKYCKFKKGIKIFDKKVTNYNMKMENITKLPLMGMYGKIEEKSVSVNQQILMGQAYALKKGDIDLKDIDPEYRDKIEGLANSMSLKDLKDFAETKHKGLPIKKESIDNYLYQLKESLNSNNIDYPINENFFNYKVSVEEKLDILNSYIYENFSLIFDNDSQNLILNESDFGESLLTKLSYYFIKYYEGIEIDNTDTLIEPFVDLVKNSLEKDNIKLKGSNKDKIETIYDYIMINKDKIFKKELLNLLNSDEEIPINIAISLANDNILKFEEYKKTNKS